jgi:hypothetical protein
VLYVVCHVERQVLWDMLCCMLYATWSGGCCGRRCTHAATWTHHPARPACVGTAGQGIMPSLQSAREAPPFAQHEHATLRVARHRRRRRRKRQHATCNKQHTAGAVRALASANSSVVGASEAPKNELNLTVRVGGRKEWRALAHSG